MRVNVSAAGLRALGGDCLAVTVWSDDLKRRGIESPDLQTIDREAHGALSSALSRGQFTGKGGDETSGVGRGGRAVVFLGAGKRDGIDAHCWVTLAARAVAAGMRRHAKTVILAARGGEDAETVRLLAEGAHLGGYRHRPGGKSRRGEGPAVRTVTLAYPQGEPEPLEVAAAAGGIVGEAVAFARDLVNSPGNVMPARVLAERAGEWCEAGGVEVSILGRKELEELGCGGILAVNQGSTEPPRMIVMRHRPEKARRRPHLALVGKGVTFDTGGISLKPGKDMHHMKCDMAGAAAVIAAMGAIGRLGLPINVTGVVPSTDNMPDGNAIKPGDVITCLGGKTVEVQNTDAEGRLILADALAHTCKEFKPSHLVDYATLTGACMVALGERIAGAMSTDDGFRAQVCDVAAAAGERLWPLPLGEDFSAQMKKSDVADLANISASRWAGAETAGAFLQEFVSGPKWCHVDIAGPSYATSAHGPHRVTGGTGFGVSMSVALAENLAKT